MALEDMATGQDLINALLRETGQSFSLTDDYYTRAKAAILQSYWEILVLHRWPFAIASPPGILTTLASINVTVASITGSTVTLSAAITPTVAGRKFYVSANQSLYRILTHTAGTATLTLDAPYVETNTSGAGVIYMDEYALDPSCMKLWGPMLHRGQRRGEVAVITEPEFKAKFGTTRTSAVGFTEEACVIRDFDPGSGSTKSLQIQVAPWTEASINIEYDYTRFRTLTFDGVAATDTPVLRLYDRWVISERAAWQIWRAKNDDLADSAWIRQDKHLDVMYDMYLKPSSKQRMWSRPRFTLGG